MGRLGHVAAGLISLIGASAAHAGEIDHVILGVPDLETASAELSARTGVATAVGGVHTHGDTANRLASLGEGRYLELLGPAPGRTPFDEGATLAALTSPLPYGFAIRIADAEAEAARLKAAGLKVTSVQDGGRTTPDGRVLSWKTFAVEDPEFCAVLPFFIEWGPDTPHPSTTSPGGARLKRLRAFHPHADALSELYRRLGVPVQVRAGEVRLELTLEGPKGHAVFAGAPPCAD
jgi:catechol 2,3-dioxygenase-like lactoylglutathione lyase family enzyme